MSRTFAVPLWSTVAAGAKGPDARVCGGRFGRPRRAAGTMIGPPHLLRFSDAAFVP